jgi:glyoxalase family protein
MAESCKWQVLTMAPAAVKIVKKDWFEMKATVHGIHHVTAIAGDPQQNLNFYVGTLGLRLVKKSVNQDAPDTYHLFYADSVGTPGTDLTFFPWPQMDPAIPGVGSAVEVSFAVAPNSLSFWRERLELVHAPVGAIETRFGERVLPFKDPHGLPLALVETTQERPFSAWAESPVPMSFQLRGMHAVRLWERNLNDTEALLTQVLGFAPLGAEDGWHRYGVEGGESGKLVEVKELPRGRRGQWGTGGVHHVAWRVHDIAEQKALREMILQAGSRPTERIDRFWFESVYFKEPGGVLFELATDGPGFARDEDAAHLGERLILPPWLEPHRNEIEDVLPALEMPRIPATL